MRLPRAIRLTNYLRYSVDLYIRLVMQRLWCQRGAILGEGIVWLGMPVLMQAPGSYLSIGDRCLICSRSSQTALGVSHPVILRTLRPGAALRIGSGVRMSGTTICAADQVTIGDRCVIGADVIIADTDFHTLDPALRASPADAAHAAVRPVTIGADVFIGGRSIILKGVQVGTGAVIGAGSVVVDDVPSGAISAGNPARMIKTVQGISGLPTTFYKPQ